VPLPPIFFTSSRNEEEPGPSPYGRPSYPLQFWSTSSGREP